MTRRARRLIVTCSALLATMVLASNPASARPAMCQQGCTSGPCPSNLGWLCSTYCGSDYYYCIEPGASGRCNSCGIGQTCYECAF